MYRVMLEAFVRSIMEKNGGFGARGPSTDY